MMIKKKIQLNSSWSVHLPSNCLTLLFFFSNSTSTAQSFEKSTTSECSLVQLFQTKQHYQITNKSKTDLLLEIVTQVTKSTNTEVHLPLVFGLKQLKKILNLNSVSSLKCHWTSYPIKKKIHKSHILYTM